MNLEIILKKELVVIKLTKNKKIVDKLEIIGEKNLSNILLAGIDKILTKNKQKKESIKKVVFSSQIPESYVSSRIAKSIKKSIDFALKIK